MISLCFVGDYCPARRPDDGENSVQLVCIECQESIDSADVSVANLESCLVEDGCECDRFMAVKEPDCDVVAQSGFNVLSLANNHILDCGPDSLRFARNYLREAGIQTVGAGMNIDEANAPLMLARSGRRIAILSVSDATHYRARTGRAGISPLDRRRLKNSVRRASAGVDLVVVCIHSDLEFTNYPAPWKVRLSRELVRVGADIVVHHHPHTLQGIEAFEGGLIAYSMGNFVFPVHGSKYMREKAGGVTESAILEVDVRFTEDGKKTITHKAIPAVIRENNATTIADGQEAAQILGKLSQYSRALEDRTFLRRHYFGLCREQARRFMRGSYYALRKGGVVQAYAFLRVHLTTRMHRNWMRGFLSLGRF